MSQTDVSNTLQDKLIESTDQASPRSSSISMEAPDHRSISIHSDIQILSPSPRPSAPSGLHNNPAPASQGGLSSAQAAERLAEYGPNSIEEIVTPLWLKLVKHYIGGPMQIMIAVAAALSIGLEKWPDVGVMTTLLLLNGTISFYETQKAGNAIAQLKKNLAAQAKVYRDGNLVLLDAAELVPGDRIFLKLGDIVPADATLCEGRAMTVDESSLTGESLPVEKRAGEALLGGSAVKTGEVDAIIDSTGKNTFMGQSAHLMNKAQPRGHFEKILLSIALCLVAVAIVLVIVIFCHSLTISGVSISDNIQLCMVVLVASIPIALPVVATSTMAVGAQRLAQHNAVVSRLAAIEELAGMDILCSDKTGTLTLNELTIERPASTLSDFSEDELFTFAALAAKQDAPDAIDSAIKRQVDAMGINLSKYTTLDHIPFDPDSKRAISHVQLNGREFMVAKGAPQKLYEIDGDSQPQSVIDQVEGAIEAFAQKGWRPLGVARKMLKTNNKDSSPWEYVGVMALYDPPRHDTKETIEASLELGVDVKMVTGDHLLVAKETARQLGLGTKIHGPEDFKKAQARGEKFCQNVVFNADGFAQVMPEDKYYIVEKLQTKGHITGMTGDGVNDAPALKLADCGIAVAGATDAARAAADIVLLSPGLSTITEAIMRARKIFQRLKNYVIYRINATVQILIFMFISVMFLDEYYYENNVERELHHLDSRAFRLPAIVLVLIAIVNDFTIMSIAYDNVFPSPEPEKWHLKQTCAVACTLGLYGVLEVYIVFVSCKPSSADNTSSSFLFSGREMWNKTHAATFLALAVGGQLSVFAARTHKFFFSRRPGYCLMTAVFGAFIVNLVLGSTNALWTGDQKGCEVKETAIIVGFLFASFLLKDLLKVVAYSLLEYDPFKSWREEEVGRQANQRTAARQLSLYGTLDPERISSHSNVRATRELYRSICEEPGR